MNAQLPLAYPIRPEAAQAPTSGIVDAMSYGRGRPGLIPLWVGEGHRPTPAFIGDALRASLAAGETFYTWQRGIPELRAALAAYDERLNGRRSDPERFYVTMGGMHAMQTAIRLVAGPGDEVIVPTPAWPNFIGALTVAGATPVAVPMGHSERGWALDLDRVAAAIGPRTRALVINTPANPTGWTASRDELAAILDLARRHGLWIVADEIYGRFVHDPALAVGGRAASFKDVMAPEDRVLFVQTFSKNWAMTGWRVGWLEAPPALGQAIENLLQYSSSGTATFVQRAAVTALEDGESFVAEQIADAREGRRIVHEGLAGIEGVTLAPPSGAFYAFFKVRGAHDSYALARRLIDEANVGLAPGEAFGPGGEGGLRLCYARRAEDVTEAVRRLAPVLGSLAG
ncbi:pyridoxal phosphate-dependent aminotransferase [Salinarimonas soli]|uniref:aspartate transaminase n=1 Tax=Salinarimonas soli TaxID=1638099 RepID=A0A5B2VC78_9HYPH|nr:pyridoxal phosphate-dependent aminotransferase [Salinarimonas soli]KAA2235707.1 pyridoxal phosphate-dependent aminotransferase [Salinarimonas soli]